MALADANVTRSFWALEEVRKVSRFHNFLPAFGTPHLIFMLHFRNGNPYYAQPATSVAMLKTRECVGRSAFSMLRAGWSGVQSRATRFCFLLKPNFFVPTSFSYPPALYDNQIGRIRYIAVCQASRSRQRRRCAKLR